jgi:hypothetical protein
MRTLAERCRKIMNSKGFQGAMEAETNLRKLNQYRGTYYRDKPLISLSKTQLMDAIIELMELSNSTQKHIREISAMYELRSK